MEKEIEKKFEEVEERIDNLELENRDLDLRLEKVEEVKKNGK